MFSTNQGGFSDELIGLDIAHRRELRNLTDDAQAVVDQQDRRILALQRQLAVAKGQLAHAQAGVRSLKAERGERNMSRIIAALQRNRTH